MLSIHNRLLQIYGGKEAKMNNTIKMISLLLIFSFMNGGCSKETDSKTVTIALSPIYSTYPDDINETQVYKAIARDTLLNRLTYEPGVKQGQIVDNSIFNFLITFTFSSSKDLRSIFTLIEHDDVRVIFYKCDSPAKNKNILLREDKKNKVNGKYNYQVYAFSNYWASYGFFDDITDICLKVNDTLNTQTTEYNYTSNTVVIPAQEIKNMLDGLGIPYE